MTVPELIEEVLGVIGRQFYYDQPIRNFLRDERALTKAIAAYGYQCAQRGWDFDAQFIKTQLLTLLNEIKRSGAEIRYLPSYLDGAVKRMIGQRAEELSDRAKSLAPKVSTLVNGVKPVVVIEKTDTEILAALYRDLKRKGKRHAKGAKQEVLL